MNEDQARDEIRLIHQMIERTRRITAGSWMFFLVWGILAVLGVGGMYTLVLFEKYTWIWLNWIFFMGAGVLFSIAYGRRLERRSEAKTYSQIATAHLSVACGVAFFMVGFILPLLGLYDWGLIPILVSMVAGVFVFALSGIYEWNLLKWCGLVWWLGGLGMAFIHENYRGLMFVPLIVIGYILPALVLRSNCLKQRDDHAA
jgi:hypothetical protein